MKTICCGFGRKERNIWQIAQEQPGNVVEYDEKVLKKC